MAGILVTGGAGYIGSRLIRDLIDRGDGPRIRILDNFQRQNHHALFGLPRSGGVEVVHADILDAHAVRAALGGIDTVVHLAATVRTPFSFDHPEWVEHVNHWGTAHLVEHALEAGVRRFVFASSASVYGPGEAPHGESDVCRPIGPYSKSKLLAEDAVALAGRRGLEVCILRLATVYGAAPAIRFDALVNHMTYEAGTKGRVIVHGSGRQARSLVHVADAAAAIVHVMDAEELPPGPLNVSGAAFTVNEITETLRSSIPELGVVAADQHALTELSLVVETEAMAARGWRAERAVREGIEEILGLLAGVRPVA